MKIFLQVFSFFKSIILENIFKGIFKFNYEHVLHNIDNQVKKSVKKQKLEEVKIMFGPSFCVYPPSYVSDKLLSIALQLKGAKIIPIYCDAIQTIECNYFGGEWGGGEFFKRNCDICVRKSEELWKKNPIPAIKLSSYLNNDYLREIEYKMSSLVETNWIDFTDENMPIGSWAKDILINNYLVGDYRLIKNNFELGRAHIRNFLVLKQAYSNVIDSVKPDRIVCNDSFYGLWAILQHLSKMKGISFYSSWPVTKDRIAFASDDAAMNLNFRKAWPKFTLYELTDLQKKKIQSWLDGNRGLLINTRILGDHQNVYFELGSINHNKPTALLASNLIWDLGALNKQLLFYDMMDWIVQTIEWFRVHDQYQLIIKPHPAETNPSIRATYETVTFGLAERSVVCPPNVFLLSSNVQLTIYDIIPIVQVGLVHTTTVGFEMAALGLPVITTAEAPYRGFGFTLDPVTSDEYFEFLEGALKQRDMLNNNEIISLSFKFIQLYQFHYFSKIGLFEAEWGKEPVLNVKSTKQLMPGQNRHLDYITDSIIFGQPIVSEERWPSES